MSSSIDWAKLTAEGRVKAPGMPWSNEEMEAIYKKGMKPDDVRAGYLDPKDLIKAQSDPKPKTIDKLKKDELIAMAKELGIEFDENVATRGDLILEIKKAEAAKAKGDK